MKMFYTQKELSKLTPEELLDLVSFDGGGTTYYFSNLDKVFTEDEDEYCIVFNDGTEIFTKDTVVFEKVKTGKARYDLIGSMLQEKEQEEAKREEFYEEMKSFIGKELTNIHNQTKTNRTNFDLFVADSEKKNADMIKKIDSTLSSLASKWDEKLTQIDKFNTAEFDAKMDKVQKITEAFSELLEK